MDYVKPHDIVKSMLSTAEVKLNLPVHQLLMRGALAGGFLAVATSLAVVAAVETGLWIVGSLLFPFGLCPAILLGMELLTSSFGLLPCATAAGKGNASPRQVLANWGWVFLVLFFAQGFEHTVVNMFAIPMGMLLGANVSLSGWWFWNQIPVTLGNLVGGMIFTGLAMYYTHGNVAPVPDINMAAASQREIQRSA